MEVTGFGTARDGAPPLVLTGSAERASLATMGEARDLADAILGDCQEFCAGVGFIQLIRNRSPKVMAN